MQQKLKDSLGQWLWDLTMRCRSGIFFDGATRIEGDGTQMLSNIDEVIARLSRFYTFRRGDILLLGAPQAPISIDPDHRIETFVGEERVTAFNVK